MSAALALNRLNRGAERAAHPGTKILDLVASSYDFYRKAVALRQTLAGDQKQIERHPGGDAAITALKEFDQKTQRLQGSEGGFGGGGRGGRQAPGIRAAQPLHRLAGFDRGWPGRRAHAGHADRLRRLLPRPGHRRAALERTDEDRSRQSERRTREAEGGRRCRPRHSLFRPASSSRVLH